MSDNHNNEPREVGYNKSYKEDIFKAWTNRESSSLFAGATQADLFFFAMAVGFNRNKFSLISPAKNKANDVSVNALSESQKWGILCVGIAKNNDLLVLKDERPIYSDAEQYANEGIKILQSHVDNNGTNYPKHLEAELRELLNQ
jgi:hypothetical protein